MNIKKEKTASPAIGTTTTSEAAFLVDLFNAFNVKKIEYCVLRNYEGLPFNLEGHDLDILLSADSLNVATRIIAQIASIHCGLTVWKDWNDYVRLVLCTGVGDDKVRWGVHIDLLSAIRWHGCEYYSSKNVLARKKDKNSVRVADNQDAILIAFLDKLLVHGVSYEAYTIGAAENYSRMGFDIKSELRQKFGKCQAEYLFKFLENRIFEEMNILSKRLRRSLQIRAMLQSPIKTLKNKSKRLKTHFSRILSRPGIFVVMMGCDGAGKSTLINMIKQEIYRLIHMFPENVFHRPSLLPRLAVLAGKDVGPLLPTNPTPHATPPNGIGFSIIKLAYYVIDFSLGYWVRVFPRLVKPPLIFFFDRYFYDYFIDPKRFRASLPNWILGFAECFIPKPDLIVMLKGDPEKLFNRKPELPVKELKKQMERMDKLSKRLKNVICVDTTGRIEESLKQILDAVMLTLMRQTGWSKILRTEEEEKS